MSDLPKLARFYRALGDETRLRLVELLTHQSHGRAWCVGRLAQELDVTTSAVSQHLRVLRDLGLLVRDRRGAQIHYFLDEERLSAFRALATERLGNAFAVPEPPTETEERDNMPCSQETCNCQHPEKKAEPHEKCTPERIVECHGPAATAENHACTCGCDCDCHDSEEKES